MADRDALLADGDEAYGELHKAVAGLDEASMHRVWLGTWGTREILVHISGWHREMLPALARIRAGQPPHPEGVSYDDFDAWNAQFVEARAGVKSADVLDELSASHRDFMAAARALPTEHLAEGGAARDLFLGVGTQHYREHAEQIRSWRERAGL
ncbi:MAG TPA: ClbS/DfsB family four-helix bundle protein [Candidatus Binatia bacterium]|nr:ClbS/DfsB family four-helix bundle protein [Candidatus Binatia bacterium]